MKKLISRVLLFTSLIAFVFTAFSQFSVGIIKSFSSARDNTAIQEEKIYCEATLKDEFADDIISVVLTKTATFEFKPYTEKDFPELKNISVYEVTTGTAELVKKQLELEKAGKMNELDKDQMRFDTETYRRIIHIKFEEKSKENVLSSIKLLEKREDVLSASPSFPGEICSTYPSEWSTLTNNQKWGLDKIGMPNAWDVQTGSSTVTVAVIDSGIDFSHPDLKNRESSAIQSYDYILEQYGSIDPNGHGTHVTGIIEAEANNGGFVGVAWDVRFVSMRVFDADGKGYYYSTNMERAIEYAAFSNIPIINHSGGLYAYQSNVEQAIINYPGLFVAAAGNDEKNNDSTPYYPASYRLPNVISVGATNQNDQKASFSNYGVSTVDIYAPGVDIYSTFTVDRCFNALEHWLWGTRDCEFPPNWTVGALPSLRSSIHNSDGYHSMEGTSMATPFVSGVSALMLSQRPGMGARAVKELLQWSGADITISTPAGNQSVKRLDEAAALDAISDGVTTITTASEFNDIRNNPWGHYVLDNDIDLSSYSSWTPIPVLHCEGILDGNGYKITGLQIPELRNLVGNSTKYIGLFARNNGTIMNLFIENAFFDSHHADHREVWSHVGFVVGFNDPRATIKDVRVTGEMNLHRSYSTMGGIVGKNQGLIYNCKFGDDYHISRMFGNGDMGGIAGENSNNGVIMNSYTHFVDINHYLTSTGRSIGGIVGYNSNATIANCEVAYVDIANAGQDYTNTVPSMGTVVGHASDCNVWNVYVNYTTLEKGTLGGHQLANFGAHCWQQIGSFSNVIYL